MRKGKFTLAKVLATEHKCTVDTFLARCTAVTKVETTTETTYTAVYDGFDEIDEGAEIPEYVLHFSEINPAGFTGYFVDVQRVSVGV